MAVTKAAWAGIGGGDVFQHLHQPCADVGSQYADLHIFAVADQDGFLLRAVGKGGADAGKSSGVGRSLACRPSQADMRRAQARTRAVAEGLNVALPMSYADKRREWSAAAALRLTTDGAAAPPNLNRSA